MTMNTFSIQEVLTFGWETFKKDPWFYVGVTAALTLFSMIVNALTGGGHGLGSLLGLVVSFLASAVVSIAYARLALTAETGTHAGWGELWAPEHFLNMLGASIIQSVVIMFGFILLIVPGVVAALILLFVQFSVVDKKMNPIEAVKNSYYLTKGHLFELFLLALTLIILNFVGLIALVVGLFVTVPVTVIATARVYRILSVRQEPAVVAAVTPPAPVE